MAVVTGVRSALKPCGGVSVAILVELRQPRANPGSGLRRQLAWRGTLLQGKFGKVDPASKEAMPKLSAAAKPIGNSFTGMDPLQ